MAHECPDCGMQCHCGGDIDDLLLNVERYVNRCTHCEDDRFDDYDDFDEDDDRCDRCCGEGFIEYIDGGPEVWGEDCPSEENHLVSCPRCRGTGIDQTKG